MAVHNASIAETLRHVADLLEIEGANPFRIRAYRRAAQTVEDLPQSAAKMVVEGKNAKMYSMPGLGWPLRRQLLADEEDRNDGNQESFVAGQRGS
jgi:DNA polymerase (family 10)